MALSQNIKLNANEIYRTLANLIVGVQTFADPIASGYDSLVDRARVEGSTLGDTILKISTDILNSYEFKADTEEQCNVLAVHRAKDPEVQAITIDTFRQVAVTLDSWMTKRGFLTERAFVDFNGVLESWLKNTKKVEDQTAYNAFIGTNKTENGEQEQTLELPTWETTNSVEEEAYNRLVGQKIAEKVANILTELKDPGTDYNDNGFMRSYNPDDIIIVWNSKYYNKILKTDLPTIYHKDGLVDKFDEKNVLPAKYFGNLTTGDAKPSEYSDKVVRAAKTITYGGKTVYAGQVLTGDETVPAGHMYVEDDNVICKIIHKNSVPFMSGFEVATSFVNGKNLSTNMYLTYGRNTLEHLKEYPYITLTAVEA